MPKGFPTPQHDPLKPDNETVVWPIPHDPKADLATIIDTGLRALGIDDVPVIKEGGFPASLLLYDPANTGDPEQYVSRPVITITRASERAERQGIGRLYASLEAGSELLVDPGNVVPPDTSAAFTGEQYDTTVDISINDLNSGRADQMYLICRKIVMAGLQELMRVGYIDVVLVNGGDQSPMDIDDPAPGVMSTRTLTYQCLNPDYVVDLEHAVNIVKQSMQLSPSGTLQTYLSELSTVSLSAGAVIK